jgi:carboxypeptidase T
MTKRNSQLPIIRLLALLSLTCLVLVGTDGSGSVGAQAPVTQTAGASSILMLRVYYQDRAEYIRLANEFGLEEAQSPRGYLLLPADQAMLDTLRARGLRVAIDQAETDKINANPPIFGHNADTFFGGYYTVEEMEAFLGQKQTQYPTLAQRVDYGDTWCKTHPGQCTLPNNWNGYDMYAMRITNQNIPGPKPVFWFNAGLHPRELVPPEVAIRYINWLLDGYNTNADARWLVDYHEIWIVPMSNPDGHHIVENGEATPRTQRKNADKDDGCTTWPPTGANQFGTDLNRNFPFMWACCGGSSGVPCNLTYRGPAQDSEEETQAITSKVRALIADQRGPNDNDPAPITTTGIFMDMHSNARLTLYPWGQTFDPAPNSTDLRNIAKHMSAPSLGGNGYHMEQSVGLYPTDGASDDWEYGELGGPGFTIELASGGSFMPPYTAVETDWNANRNALIHMSKISRMPYLMTRGPDTNLVSATPMTVTQGTPANLTSTINYNWAHTDPVETNSYLQNVAAAEYYIDTPPWAGGTPLIMAAADGSYNSPTEAVQATVNTASLAPGRHVLLVRGRGVNDYSGYQSWGAISATFLDVLPGGGSTSTPTAIQGTPATSTRTVTNTRTSTPTNGPSATPISGNRYCSTQSISIAPNGPASPYPANINVTGLSGTVTGVTVELNGTLHEFMDDVDIMLVGPQGQTVILLSDAGGTCNHLPSTTLFSDGAPPFPDEGCAGGTQYVFSPSNYGENPDPFPTPAPGPPYGTTLSAFNGTNPNGTWSLYVVDDYPAFGGIMSGWCISIAVTAGTPATAPPTGTPVSTPPVTYTPTVTGAGCAALFGTGSSTCAAPSVYDYTFTFYNESGCTTSATGPATLTFEVGETLSGPFGAIDVQTRTVTFPPGPAYVSFQGVMTETNIPSQFTAYRITFNASAVRQLAYATTTPNYLCGQATATSTRTSISTSTTTSTATNTPTGTPPTVTPTSTACALQFTDVPTDHTFYTYIQCLACRGIINGYSSGCETGNPCFRPGNLVTRGQIAKIVSNSAGFSEPAGAQQFEDVPPGSTFFDFIWRLADRGIVSGYLCGGPGEPCVPPDNLPYFRPNNNVTRGQLSKIVSEAAGFSEPAGAQQFEDVPPGHTFYAWIWRLTSRGIINGYPCGGLGEPCIPPDNRPYFRPGANATRGQASKIVANTFFPECAP